MRTNLRLPWPASLAVAVFLVLPLATVAPTLPANSLSAPVYAAESIRNPRNPCFWENLSWDELRRGEQSAWTILGWTAASWDSEDEDDASLPESDYKDWIEFSPREQAALRALGYDQERWDNFDSAQCP